MPTTGLGGRGVPVACVRGRLAGRCASPALVRSEPPLTSALHAGDPLPAQGLTLRPCSGASPPGRVFLRSWRAWCAVLRRRLACGPLRCTWHPWAHGPPTPLVRCDHQTSWRASARARGGARVEGHHRVPCSAQVSLRAPPASAAFATAHTPPWPSWLWCVTGVGGAPRCLGGPRWW
jgi:hypothetical protein